MQPTFSKTSTHALRSERRAATAEPRAATGPAFQHRRAHLLPADPARPAERYRLREDERGLGSDASSPPGSTRAPEALTEIQATKIVCTTGPLKNGGFPIRDAFRRWGALSSPWPVPARGERTAPTSDAPSPVARYRFGLARPVPLPAATESGHTEPTPPTDFCNRQRAWAHRVNDCSSHRTRCFGAFCWIGIIVSEPASGTVSGADAPYAREQNRTGLQGPEPACAKVAQWPTRDRPAEHPVSFACPPQQDLVDLHWRTCDQDLPRPAARTVRAWSRPGCFRPLGNQHGS